MDVIFVLFVLCFVLFLFCSCFVDVVFFGSNEAIYQCFNEDERAMADAEAQASELAARLLMWLQTESAGTHPGCYGVVSLFILIRS